MTRGSGDQVADALDDRTRLVLAAVQALMAHADAAPLMAAHRTAQFVQLARAAFKRHGLTFSDDELRNVHDGLRLLVEARSVRARTQA